MTQEGTVRAHRERFWREHGFGRGGGYDDPWATASFGGIPYTVPNSKRRAEALRVHDLHHLVTGYGTDWTGESEIAAWELGSGGAGRYPYAWLIAVFGFVIGVLALPLRTLRAFALGRRSRNLYRAPTIEPILDLQLLRVRRRLLPAHPDGVRLSDLPRFVALSLLAVPVGLALLATTPAQVLLSAARTGCPCRARLSAG